MSVLNHIHAIIQEIKKPSWLGTAPALFGSKRVGSLKADKWCVLAELFIPLALISLWGNLQSKSSVDLKLKQALDHTMDLVVALRLCALQQSTKDS